MKRNFEIPIRFHGEVKQTLVIFGLDKPVFKENLGMGDDAITIAPEEGKIQKLILDHIHDLEIGTVYRPWEVVIDELRGILGQRLDILLLNCDLNPSLLDADPDLSSKIAKGWQDHEGRVAGNSRCYVAKIVHFSIIGGRPQETWGQFDRIISAGEIRRVTMLDV